MVAWGRGPLNAIRRHSPEERLLRGAKDGCATEGLVIATYTALEVMARGAGDTGIAQLAADIRADEQRMLEWLRHEILKLTDTFIRDELDELDPIERPQRQRVPGKRVWADYDELSVGEVRHALSRSDARGHHETPRTFATGGPGNGSGMNDGDSPKDKVRKLEENPPERIEDWPDDEAKYETFGGPEGDHTYEEGPESKLGPSSLRHHEGGDVSIDGEKVEDPERYK